MKNKRNKSMLSARYRAGQAARGEWGGMCGGRAGISLYPVAEPPAFKKAPFFSPRAQSEALDTQTFGEAMLRGGG